MMISNPLQMNDWNIKKFLMAILSIQFAVWGLIGLNTINIHIPLLRPLICFIYLTFVPGILILRILKQHELGNIETTLYSVGLSLGTLMFIGLFLNTLKYLFGINKPLSSFHLLISISALIVFFSILSYLTDKNYSHPNFIKLENNHENLFLFLIFLPILSILGSQLVNYYNNNIVLLILIPILSLTPILVCFNKIPEKFYQLTIFIVGLSLIYHTALISQYIWGLDVHTEYYLANLVIKNSYWNIKITDNVNSMLAVVMLGPIYVKLLGIDLTMVIKVIFTFLFSLLPLGLYSLYKKQFVESVYSEKLVNKIVFLACFFFVSFEFFYFNAPTGWRQEIAEIFLVLTLMVMFDKKLTPSSRSILIIIFILSLGVSHYGTSYLWMFVLLASFLIVKIKEHFKDTPEKLLNSTYILLFVVFTISWYIYSSSSSPFDSIVHIGNQIGGSLFDLLNPDSSAALNIIVNNQYSFMSTLEKYIQLIAQAFIGVGVLWILVTRNRIKLNSVYLVLVLLNFVLLVLGVSVPYFSNQLSPWRLYQITMIILAPIGILGAFQIFKFLTSFKGSNSMSSIKLISIFFTVFLLFNTCWIYGLANEYPQSTRAVSLYQNDINNGTNYAKNNFYSSFYTDGDIYGVEWLSKNRNSNYLIYADYERKLTILQSYGMIKDSSKIDFRKSTLTNKTQIKEGYLFLGYPNTKFGLIYRNSNNFKTSYWDISTISSTITKLNEVYDSGTSKIYWGSS